MLTSCVSPKRSSNLTKTSVVLNKECTQVFRLDRVTTSSQDLSNGGIMIACATSLLPESTNFSHSILEVKSVTLISHYNLKICVVVVYQRPQLPMETFLPLLDNYLSRIPHQTMPTIVLGDFNDDVSTASSSQLLRMMSSKGFSQLVKVPTTDSGSSLDHIY